MNVEGRIERLGDLYKQGLLTEAEYRAEASSVLMRTDIALWNPKAVANWAMALSPILGAVLVAYNWAALGDTVRATQARIWAAAGAVLAIICLVDSAGDILVFPFFVAWYFASCRPQVKVVKERFGKHYVHRGWVRPLGMAAAAWVVYVLLQS